MMIRRTLASVSRAKNASSNNSTLLSIPFWGSTNPAPADPILGITEDFAKDTNTHKVNLSVGAYRDGEGAPCVLPSIQMAEAVLSQKKLNKEYTGITGSKSFTELVGRFLYGSFSVGTHLLEEDRVVVAQSLSGTGALKLVGELIKQWSPHSSRAVYTSSPTWANHDNIFANCGLEPRWYAYYDTATNSLDIEGLKRDLGAAEQGSAVLLHACCHNPTGLDPTAEQWKEILAVVIDRGLIPIVDIAYQGFQSGHLAQDLFLLQLVSEACVQGLLPTAFVCQSFAKNMGLYGERVGSLSIIASDKATKAAVESQLKKTIRSIYSSPPIHGSQLVEIVLFDEAIFAQWNKDVQIMAERIRSMRTALFEQLAAKSARNWEHLIQQNGMFAYTGLTPAQISQLKSQYSIYATMDGRFSISGLNEGNVTYVAEAVDAVTR